MGARAAGRVGRKARYATIYPGPPARVLSLSLSTSTSELRLGFCPVPFLLRLQCHHRSQICLIGSIFGVDCIVIMILELVTLMDSHDSGAPGDGVELQMC
jgi:hypothetical protein